MKKEQAMERIAAIEKELAELRKIVEAPDLRPYSLENPPKNGEVFFFAYGPYAVERYSMSSNEYSRAFVAAGNVHRTQAEALAHGEKMRYTCLIKNVGEPPLEVGQVVWCRPLKGNAFTFTWEGCETQILMWRVGLIAATKEELA